MQRGLPSCSHFFCTSITLIHGFQGRKEVKLSKIYNDVISSSSSLLEYDNIKIIDDLNRSRIYKNHEDLISSLKRSLGKDVSYDTSGLATKVKEIYFDNVRGENIAFEMLNLTKLEFKNGEFQSLEFIDIAVDTVYMDSTKVFDSFTIHSSNFTEFHDYRNNYQRHEIFDTNFRGFYMMSQTVILGELRYYNTLFGEGGHFGPFYEGTFADFLMDGCTFEPIDSDLPLLIEDYSPDSTVFKTQAYFNLFGDLYQMNLSNTKFLSAEDEQFIFIQGNFEYMGIEGNTIASQFYPQVTVSKQMAFVDNEVTGNIIFSELILEGKNNLIRWDEIKGYKMAAGLILETLIVEPITGLNIPDHLYQKTFQQTSDLAIVTYKGLTEEEFEDEETFQGLISSYYRLYKAFKENGQIKEANHVYVEMKDVQMRLQKYDYQTYGGLENWIQWRLNGLLKFYTDHGTNPSRAIKISIFVISIFSIFYFFFPSEWDTKSKKQLIGDYKRFAEKNEHGYFKPFLKLGMGFFISLLNAMTLSLNSFVTLGFGAIPTTGLARYVCILQGFLGWFLLSVFTASLINQVMF